MNLHAIAGPLVSRVNPWLVGSYQQSSGYTTSAGGKRTPTFATAVPVQIQVQALSWQDLQQLVGLNINGERRAIYISGSWDGVSRPESKGGDIVTLPDGTVWMVAQVLENWGSTDGWVKVAVTRQMAAP